MRRFTKLAPVTRRLSNRLQALRTLGPGLVAGASDNDPTTVASLSVIGATTVYGLSWLVVLVIPMLICVQVVAAAVGAVTKSGLESAIVKRYGRAWGAVTLVTVLAVNLITLAADLEGGAAALGLLSARPYQWFVLPFAVAVAGLLIWGSYRIIEKALRYVSLVFLAYVVAAIVAHPQWSQVLHATIVPQFRLTKEYVAGTIALLGTTLTSYAYFWETIEQSENRPPLRRLQLITIDAALGMLLAGMVFWFIVVATGATLGLHHRQVETAQDAASALAPFAGRFASLVFGLGLLASSVIAVPVLAATSAYVTCPMFGWKSGMDKRMRQAPHFYALLIAALAVAVALTFLNVPPIKLLFLGSIAGGLGTPVTLCFLMLLGRDVDVMQGHRVSRGWAMGGWGVTAIVSAASALYLWQARTGGM